jgi:hypothetical protein
MAQITLNSTGVASSGSLALQSNGTTTAVTIDTSQNVGIGTASPGSILELNRAGSGAVGPNLYLENSASSATGNASRVSFGIDAGSSAASPTAYIENVKDAAGPGSSYLAFGTFGASLGERMRIDSSGNVGIGTGSPTSKLDVLSASGANTIFSRNTGTASSDSAQMQCVSGAVTLQSYAYSFAGEAVTGTSSNHPLVFRTNATERARIDSSGNLLVGTTSTLAGGRLVVDAGGATAASFRVSGGVTACNVYNLQNSNYNSFSFSVNNGATVVGNIAHNTTSTSFNTSSDYRLKHDIQPMIGALSKVAQLKPVTYKWNADDSESQGFIAHELQEVVPECVTGEKDAVDADGNPQYQGIDVSFLVATLTAAIQELKVIVDAQAVEIAALKGTA